jgi:hypothetical protein
MLITRLQALRDSTFAFGGAVATSQFAKAETAASRPSGQNTGIYRCAGWRRLSLGARALALGPLRSRPV